MTGTYNSKTHTVTFTLPADSKYWLSTQNTSCSYTIKCSISSEDDGKYYNSDMLSGPLYVDGNTVTSNNVSVASSSSYFMNIVTITLDANGSSASYIGDGLSYRTQGTKVVYRYMPDTSRIYSSTKHTAAIMSIACPTRVGCQFAGYYTGTKGSGTLCINPDGSFASGIWSITKDTTLYAYWIPNVYTVYDGDNGNTLAYVRYYDTSTLYKTKSTTNGLVYAGSATGTLTPKSETGYTFIGWFSVAWHGINGNGGGRQYTNSAGAMYSGYISTWAKAATDQTVYAQWNANVYTITFDEVLPISSYNGTIGSAGMYEYYGNYGKLDPTRFYFSVSQAIILR